MTDVQVLDSQTGELRALPEDQAQIVLADPRYSIHNNIQTDYGTVTGNAIGQHGVTDVAGKVYGPVSQGGSPPGEVTEAGKAYTPTESASIANPMQGVKYPEGIHDTVDLTPDGLVKVIDKESGEMKAVPADAWEKLKGAGGQYLLPSEVLSESQAAGDFQTKVEAYKKQFAGEYGGAAFTPHRTFTEQLAGMLPGAGGEAAVNAIAGRTNIPEQYQQFLRHTPEADWQPAIEALNQLQGQNPKAEFAGKAVKFIGELALGAPVAGALGEAGIGAVGLAGAKGALPAIGRSLINNIASSAVLAGKDLAAQSIVDNDPGGAFENLGLMVGGGMMLDGLFGIGHWTKDQVMKPVLGKEQEVALNDFFKEAKFDPETMALPLDKKIQIAKVYQDEMGNLGDLSKDTQNKIANKVQERLKVRGAEIGDIYKRLDAIGDGSLMDDMIKRGDQTAADAHIFPADSINMKLSKLAEEDVGADVARVEKQIKIIQKATDDFGTLSLDKAHQISSNLGKAAANASDTELKRLYGQMRTIVKDELDRAGTVRAQMSGRPELMDKLAEANMAYSALIKQDIGALRSETSPKLAELLSGVHGSGIPGLLGKFTGKAIGGIGGFLYGGPVGALAGEHVIGEAGHTAGMMSAKFLRRWLNKWGNRQLATKGVMAIPGIANEAIVKGAVERNTLLSKIPALVKMMMQKGVSTNKVFENLDMNKKDDILKEMLGENATGMSTQKQAESVVEAVKRMTNDPHAWLQQKHDLLKGFEEYPSMQQAAEQHLDNSLMALQQWMPTEKKDFQRPYSPPVEKDFTPGEIDRIKTVMHYVENPHAMLADLHAGTLTPEKAALAMQLNPSIMQAVKSELIAQGYTGKVDLDWNQKLQMSYATGMQIAEGINNTNIFQQTWANGVAAQAAQAPAPKKQRTGHKITAPVTATTFQQIQGNHPQQ